MTISPYNLINTNFFSHLIFLLRLPQIRKTNKSTRKEDTDDVICADMCRFIQHKICHEKRNYYSKESELAKDECGQLRNWDNSAR